MARLPTEDSVVVSVDFSSLRRGGIIDLLSGAAGEEEPEYKTFLSKTSFDYRRDLDYGILSFNPTGVYFLLRGRFDWPKLEAYAREQGGGCFNSLCRMPGSLPTRKISFFPLKRDVMALAVSGNEWAATQMNEPAKRRRPIEAPDQPVWLSLPPAALKKTGSFPAGTQLFAKAMENAEGATLSMRPKGRAMEANLEVACRTRDEASLLVSQLQRVTSLLRDMIAREKQTPNPNDLSGVLTAGVFRQEDRRVFGQWPIERAFLEKIAGGR